MKKIIISAVLTASLLASLPACGKAEAELGDLSVIWVKPGITCESLRFDNAGEGLYRLEAAMPDGMSKFGYMSETGDIVIPMIYDYADPFTEGLAFVEAGGRKIFIDKAGKEVLDVSEYGYIAPFEFGYALVTRIHTEEVDAGVRLSHFSGMINASGEEVLPCEFEEAGVFENGLFWGMLDRKYALFDESGARITPHDYSSMSYAGEDLIIAEKDGGYGYLDRNGNVAVPFEYEMVGSFHDGLAFVSGFDRLAGFMDSSGEMITPREYEGAEDFSEGRAAVMKDGKFGFIDEQGNAVTPFMYDEVWPYEGGVSVTMRRMGSAATLVETIDRNGDEAVRPSQNGYYRWKDTYVGYNDPETGNPRLNYFLLALLSDDGERLTGFDFTEISGFHEGIAVSEILIDPELLYGVINELGTEIIPPVHERIEIIGNGTVILQTETEPGRSNVGIAALPEDAATRQPPPLDYFE